MGLRSTSEPRRDLSCTGWTGGRCNVFVPAKGQKWTVVVADGGASGGSGQVSEGYNVHVVGGGKRIEIEKL